LLRIADIQWTPDGGTSESIAAENQPIVATTAGATSAAASTCTRVANGRTEYVYLDGLPIALLRYAAGSATPQLSYLETDHLGTPRIAVDANTQAIQWKWDLLTTAFGDHAATSLVSGFALNLRYPGQYYDAETGLHYNYFRDYDPRAGRYVESDPIGLRDGPDTYTYVTDNPLRWFDELGKV
jgi:RHS repeat-associated protein